MVSSSRGNARVYFLLKVFCTDRTAFWHYRSRLSSEYHSICSDACAINFLPTVQLTQRTASILLRIGKFVTLPSKQFVDNKNVGFKSLKYAQHMIIMLFAWESISPKMLSMNLWKAWQVLRSPKLHACRLVDAERVCYCILGNFVLLHRYLMVDSFQIPNSKWEYTFSLKGVRTYTTESFSLRDLLSTNLKDY